MEALNFLSYLARNHLIIAFYTLLVNFRSYVFLLRKVEDMGHNDDNEMSICPICFIESHNVDLTL